MMCFTRLLLILGSALAFAPPARILHQDSALVMTISSENNNMFHHHQPQNASSTSLHLWGNKARDGDDRQERFPPLKASPPRSVCLMVEPTPFTHVSGYSNRFREMLRFLGRAGDDVKVLTVDQKTRKDQQPKSIFGHAIEHTFGWTFPLYSHISLSLDFPQFKGRRIIRNMKQKPDLIHVSSPGFMVIPAILYSKLMKIPLVMSYHTHIPMYAAKYLGFIPFHKQISWMLLRWAHTKADLTLCTSPQLRQECVDAGIPRVDVWRKGVDSQRFSPSFQSSDMRQRMTESHPDDFLILSVGRIGAEKRLKDLKPMLERMGKRARLCIVGNGPQLPYLKKYFRGTNTVFTGQLNGDELSQAFASADAFCIPSDTETLGFVVMESMASGIPVVGANAGGIPDMIQHGKTGYLVETGNEDGFIQRLQELRDDPELRQALGHAARAEAQKWTWEDATSVLRNVQYEKAVANHGQRRQRKNRGKDDAISSPLFAPC
mmetsp:Transcript_15049/g.34266  ORF Transcript_15049/g.34266 Transcript_15049/m.34266 type:complete len:490 (+) Transcript_15049:159-1628(+)